MEDEIQAGDDGYYCVGFRNDQALNKDQISDALSRYGQVCSVRGACDGVKSGWTFVRYSNPEEAVRAMTGLRNSPGLCNPNFVKYVQDAPHYQRFEDDGPGVGRGRDFRGGFRGRGQPGMSPLLRESVAGHSPVRPPSESGPVGQNSLANVYEVYVGNWPVELDHNSVRGLFDKYNIRTTDVRLYKRDCKSYAFVVLTCGEDVSRSIDLLNGGKVAGRQICVRNSNHSNTKLVPQHPSQGDGPGAEFEEWNGTVPRGRGTGRRPFGGRPYRGGRTPRPPPPFELSAADLSQMPPLVFPGEDPMGPPPLPPQPRSRPPGPGGRPFLPRGRPMRRTFGQRGEMNGGDLDGPPFVKRPRLMGDGPINMLPPVGGLPGAEDPALAATAISQRIKSRLNAPTDIVVANFPVGTTEADLMNLMTQYEPYGVRIMVNNSSHHPDDFTYAYITLGSRMAADEAVIAMDGRLYRGRPLVVESKKF